MTNVDYGPLISCLRRVILQDANQAVVIQALVCVEKLSEGLRGVFTPHAKSVFSALLEKLKEKPIPVINAVDAILDSFARWAFAVGEVVEPISEALSHSKCTSLQIKNIMLWIARCAGIRLSPRSTGRIG